MSGIQILDLATEEIQSLLEAIEKYSKPTIVQYDTVPAKSHRDTEFTDPKPTEMPSPQKAKGRLTLSWFFIIIGIIGLVSWYFTPFAGEDVTTDLLCISPAILLIILGIVATIVRVKR